MVEFLPSEVSRLALSHLLDHGHGQTRETFMKECPALEELKSLDQEQLKRQAGVGGKTLSKILNEYSR